MAKTASRKPKPSLASKIKTSGSKKQKHVPNKASVVKKTTKRSPATPDVKKAPTTVKKDQKHSHADLYNSIPVRAARTRLYTIINVPTNHSHYYCLRNREGVQFFAAKEDIEEIGAHLTTVEVTQTEMVKLLLDIKGFFFVQFYKLNGELRSMYAIQESAPEADIMHLRDLSLDNTERRSCSMKRVVTLVSHNTRYILNKAAWRSLTKKL